MDKEKLIEEIKKQDRAITAMTKDGNFRIVAIRNTNTALTAQKKHGLHHIPAYYLARHLTAASLMASFLKGEERIIIETDTNGLINRVYAEAIQAGEIRGYIDHEEELLTIDTKSEANILGDGFLKVQKILYNESDPFTGVVDLVYKDIAADLAYYYLKSEQIPTAVIIDVEFDDSGFIAHSGGLIVQQMPGASKEDTEKVFNALKNTKTLAAYFRENQTPDKVIKDIIPFEVDILKSIRLDFFCRCSKESFMQKLILLDSEEIREMQSVGNNELVCRYCNEKYILNDSDFETIISELDSKKN